MTLRKNLAEPIHIGNLDLKDRVVLAPLTRYRAHDDHVPSDLNVEYYSQRASVPGSLLITEGTFPSPRGGGYANVPGIYNEAQIKGWKKVTDAVHAKGCFIFCQLWGLGRVADPKELAKEGNYPLVSSGDIPFPADGTGTVPQPLDEAGIQQFIDEYAQAAKNAIAAGFDGVEVHSGNGYLLDQFLQSNSNNRTDRWGGSIENRARFGLEVTKKVVQAVGPKRTGFRISPWGRFQGMRMKTDELRSQFTYLVEHLKAFGLAYLHIVEPRVSGIFDVTPDSPSDSNDFLIDTFSGVVILAGGFKPESADAAVAAERARGHSNIAIAFGRFYISNPDLVYRAIHGVPFTPYNRDSFYIPQSPVGYTDYAFSDAYLQAKAAL